MRRNSDLDFSVEDASTLTSLREDVEQQLGREVDLRSAASLIRALATIGVKISVKDVGLEKTGGDSPPDPVVVQTTQTTPRHGRTAKATRHPPVVEPPASSAAVDDSRQLLPLLRERVGAHDVIEPLVQYLDLEASTPRLADEETYARLRERSADPERTEINIRFVLQRDRDDA